ncbi:MAG: NAD(P)-binding protein, partial [Alphaproteobacteria bacterium]|nr:NAD(P)-binding protein [Alphaproteobacteria bacterium]
MSDNPADPRPTGEPEAPRPTDEPEAPRPTDDIVDVLIIGAGASGAAVAWSLADTRMRILCLEQGEWIKPTDFPSTGRDWEARRYGDFDMSPNRRARPTD